MQTPTHSPARRLCVRSGTSVGRFAAARRRRALDAHDCNPLISLLCPAVQAIGPQDVLVTLLNNLKVQERQNRVCTTVAIAIVAETCSPFTVLPALMNEYKVCCYGV